MSSPINSLWKKPPLPVYKQTEANDSIHCVQQVSLARLTSTNHTCLYKKLDEFGKGHDKPLHEAVAKQEWLYDQYAWTSIDRKRRSAFREVKQDQVP